VGRVTRRGLAASWHESSYDGSFVAARLDARYRRAPTSCRRSPAVACQEGTLESGWSFKDGPSLPVPYMRKREPRPQEHGVAYGVEAQDPPIQYASATVDAKRPDFQHTQQNRPREDQQLTRVAAGCAYIFFMMMMTALSSSQHSGEQSFCALRCSSANLPAGWTPQGSRQTGQVEIVYRGLV
jgi:hypothetical protein